MSRPFRIGRSAERAEADAGRRWHGPALLAGLMGDWKEKRVRAPCRLWVMSDLRLDLDPAHGLPDAPPDFDAILVAGNVAEGLPTAVRLLDAALGTRRAGRPVFMVPGNVEYRSGLPMVEALARGRDAAAGVGITLLSDDAVRFGPTQGGGTVVVGATLWTDWQLGSSPGRPSARVAARTAWEDAGRIALRRGRPLTPLDTLALHARSRAYIEDALTSIVIGASGLPRGPNACTDVALPGDVAVVVTCHAPTPRSLPPDWRNWNPDGCLAAARASEAAAATEAWGAPPLWVHGNVPRCADNAVGRTRVLANPRFGERGHRGFDPALVIAA